MFTTYTTRKTVEINSRVLGISFFIVQLLVGLYIVGYVIIYSNQHLKSVRLHGSARLTLQQPTQKGCNPLHADCKSDYTPMSELPYCSQFKPKGGASKVKRERILAANAATNTTEEAEERPGAAPEAAGGGGGEEAARTAHARSLREANLQHPCVYYDGSALTLPIPVPNSLWMTTRKSKMEQVKGCVPSASNKFACDGEPFKFKPGVTDDTAATYVADVERFTILVDHSFESEVKSGKAADFSGAVRLNTTTPVQTDSRLKMRMKCRIRGRCLSEDNEEEEEEYDGGQVLEISKDGPQKDSPLQSLRRLKGGDVISLADLLTLADPRGAGLMDAPDADDEQGLTRRWNGGVIHLDIQYTNRKRFDVFGRADVKYILRATLLPMIEFKKMYAEGKDSDEDRTMINVHGFLLVAKVSGYLKAFDMQYLLQVLTTSVGIFAVASTAVDMLMVKCGPHKKNYELLKKQKHFQPVVNLSIGSNGRDYSLLKDKSQPYQSILADYASANKTEAAPSGKDLMHVFFTIEQRLNRLDGMDPTNIQAAARITDDDDYVSHALDAYAKDWR